MVVAVCIDDFALKKRQRYGTIMVDLETRKLIDMIESREQGDVARWLATYPNIQIVSRDGSRTYANAISEAHPNAIQISDRFHLVKGLTDYARLALQKLFGGRVAIPITDKTKQYRMIMTLGTDADKSRLVKWLYREGHSQSEMTSILATSSVSVKKYLDMRDDDIPPTKHTDRGLLHIGAVEKIQKRMDMVRNLKLQGLSINQISTKTGFINKTIRDYLSDDYSPVNAHYGKQREGKLEPYRSEVLQLKSEGLKYREIHDVIRAKGYTGTQDAIRGFISKERRIYRDLSTNFTAATGDSDTKIGGQEFIDKKWLIRLLYKPISKVKGITTQQLDFVLSEYPLYKDVLDIVSGFRIALKSKNAEALDSWMKKTLTLEIPELRSFVFGLKSDIDAVKNAITHDHSNGVAEGTINKIKVIKRIMYGRCQFELLKSKCLMLSKFN